MKSPSDANLSIADPSARVSFTRVNITEKIVFDAMTIEISLNRTGLDKEVLGDRQSLGDFGNSKQYRNGTDAFYFNSTNYCNPTACALVAYDRDTIGEEMSLSPKVQAHTLCLNDDGNETLLMDAKDMTYNFDRWTETCTQRSNSSMLVVNLAERREGGQWRNNELERPRTVYSYTVGRLAWQLEDLNTTFGAECGDSDHGCQGFHYSLRAGNKSMGRLVSGHEALGSLEFLTSWMNLVSLTLTAGVSPLRTGQLDVVFPRNFGSVTQDTIGAMKELATCNLYIEKYINHVEKNHLYMEQSLQTAYTAALYYLFQNGVAHEEGRDTSVETTGAIVPTLINFKGNIRQMHVRASIPWLNITLTLLERAILLFLSAGIVVCGKKGEQQIQEFATAHSTVDAMLNQRKYPPLFLQMALNQTVDGEEHELLLEELVVQTASVESTTQAKTQLVL